MCIILKFLSVLICIVIVGVALLMARYHRLQYNTPVKVGWLTLF